MCANKTINIGQLGDINVLPKLSLEFSEVNILGFEIARLGVD